MQNKNNNLVNLTEKFLKILHFVLVCSLVVITIGVLGLLVRDIIAFYQAKFAYGIGTLLGTLLILWVLAELLQTQIDHLKGGKFNISVFIMVAIVAFIRKLMVVSLTPDKVEIAYYPVIVVFVLGIVYWLMKKTQPLWEMIP